MAAPRQTSVLLSLADLSTAALPGAGCSTIPAPIVLPGSRAPLGGALTWAGSWGHTRATIRRADGSTATISGNGDSMYGANGTTVVGAVPPAALSAHEAANALAVTFQPYFRVAHGSPRNASCVDCVPGVELLDYTQRGGIVGAITVETR